MASSSKSDWRPEKVVVRRAYSQEHPGYLKAARMASCKSGPAPWDPLPNGFSYGAGPTIVHAQGPVSQREDDVALVAAAARGEADEVRKLLPRASSPNVRTRGCCGGSSSSTASVYSTGTRSGHATTALHAASAQGALEVVLILLAGGADPKQRQNGLRLLTPLHEAANVPVAEALLAAGAAPGASDPREPDPVWYHRHHGRVDVASLIAIAARTALRSAGRRPSSATRAVSADVQGAPRKAMPSMSAAEVAAARKAWRTTGEALRRVGAQRASAAEGGKGNATVTGAQLSASEDMECAICMVAINSTDECMMLPCNGFDVVAAVLSSSRFGKALGADVTSKSNVERPHAFHADCLERWWTKSCQCPTCRRDVRQWLKATSSQQAQKKAVPLIPDPLVVGISASSMSPCRRGLWPISPLRRGLTKPSRPDHAFGLTTPVRRGLIEPNFQRATTP